VIANERQANQLVKKYLDEHAIVYVDLLPALKKAVPVKTIYPQSEDGHPNADGYEVIAGALLEGLTRRNQ
jgi:lysophospholipase L1-like esterase